MAGIPCPQCRGYVGAHSTPRCELARKARANRERWESFKVSNAEIKKERAS